MDKEIRAALNQAIKKCGKSRDLIANEMSKLMGRKVTKTMLNAYTGESRQLNRFPLSMLLAFEIATESYNLTKLISKRRGCELLVGEDIALAKLARIERKKLALERRAQNIKQTIAEAPEHGLGVKQ